MDSCVPGVGTGGTEYDQEIRLASGAFFLFFRCVCVFFLLSLQRCTKERKKNDTPLRPLSRPRQGGPKTETIKIYQVSVLFSFFFFPFRIFALLFISLSTSSLVVTQMTGVTKESLLPLAPLRFAPFFCFRDKTSALQPFLP